MSRAERPSRRAASRERGSVLLLMPTGVLVVVVLGAIAVDFAIVFLGEREVANAAAAAANDAAVAAISEQSFYEEGRLDVDAARAGTVAAASFAQRSSGWLRGASITVTSIEAVAGERVRVTVAARGTVDTVFSKAIPGAPTTRPVSARATASALRAPP